MRKWGRKRSGSQARASALTAASALIGHTCKRPCVEHSMDMGKEDVVETFLPSTLCYVLVGAQTELNL